MMKHSERKLLKRKFVFGHKTERSYKEFVKSYKIFPKPWENIRVRVIFFLAKDHSTTCKILQDYLSYKTFKENNPFYCIECTQSSG